AIRAADNFPLILAEGHVRKGRVYQGRRQLREAAAEYEAAVKASPDYADAHRLLGEVSFALGQYGQAVRAFDRYLQPGGKPTANLLKARARAHTELHAHWAAITDYTLALKIQAAAPTYAARGWSRLVTGQTQPALEDFTEAVRLDPNNADALNGRGFARMRLGRRKQALADADRAVQLDGKTP